MRRYWLPVLCVLVQTVSVSSGSSQHRAGWTAAVAAAAGLIAGVALLRRDRTPDLVLATTASAYVVQVLAGGPVVPAAIAVATEVVTRRAAGDDRTQLRAASKVVAALAGVVVAVTLSGSFFLAAPFGVLLLAAALVGTLRAARAAHEAVIHRELVVAERLRIARDLHDVVGHGVGAITIQAGAARMAIAAGAAAEATRSLLAIEAAGRDVLTEVRWLVSLLRDDSDRPELTDVADLVSSARRSGLDVALDIDGDLRTAPVDVGEAAYRTVQEALTNVLRHSGAQAARVAVGLASDLRVEIFDGGPTERNAVHGDFARPDVVDRGFGAAAGGRFAEGNGLRGMRERVEALGGTVSIGPESEGGWSVRARFPLRRRAW